MQTSYLAVALSWLAFSSATPVTESSPPMSGLSRRDVSGSGSINYNNYMALAGNTANPSECQITYASLNVARITAADSVSSCGYCILVTGPAGSEALFVADVKAVSNSLDISDGAAKTIMGSDSSGQQQGVVQGSWKQVDDSQCSGVWNGQMAPGANAVAGNLAKLKKGL